MDKYFREILVAYSKNNVNYKSKKAFSQISFTASSPADRNIYYPKKMLRDSSARDTFFKMRSESELTNPDAVFIMDIIRGGIKNGDSRIPAILFK